MKRSICILTALLVAVFFIGCKEETLPKITRIFVSESCGVVPMRVEVYGAASGGNETGDPTGGVNNLEYTWDFGDRTGSTSISYHEYTGPAPSEGFYVITLTVTDPDGKSAAASDTVWAFNDSLTVAASMDPSAGITTATPVTFDFLAATCAVDPDSDDDYVKLTPVWHIQDPAFRDTINAELDSTAIYYGRAPTHTFSEAGTFDAHLKVYYAEWDVFRNVHMQVTVDP